jgi:hypothetical protein
MDGSVGAGRRAVEEGASDLALSVNGLCDFCVVAVGRWGWGAASAVDLCL